jgi:hypothetical protein
MGRSKFLGVTESYYRISRDPAGGEHKEIIELQYGESGQVAIHLIVHGILKQSWLKSREMAELLIRAGNWIEVEQMRRTAA